MRGRRPAAGLVTLLAWLVVGVPAASADYVALGDSYAAGPLIRWVEPVVPASPAAPVHPNLFGMLGAADLVTAGAPAPGTRR